MSDTAKRTPGPWTVSVIDGRSVGPRWIVRLDLSEVPQVRVVAIVTERTGETEANARLIAAAPDLLEAARFLLDWIAGHTDTYCDGCDRHAPKRDLGGGRVDMGPIPHAPDCGIEAARAAIAKAEGVTAHA